MGQGTCALVTETPWPPTGAQTPSSFLPLWTSDSQGLGTLLPLPLPPSPQVRLPAKTCPDRADAGRGGWGNGFGSGCHSSYKPHPLLRALSMGPSARD